ncbi:hypothetical protein Pelo_7624 [Pelomyxa schiedti]|nr:hypothetical protein Pelo_7624 [Pelomyxa schiedti]
MVSYYDEYDEDVFDETREEVDDVQKVVDEAKTPILHLDKTIVEGSWTMNRKTKRRQVKISVLSQLCPDGDPQPLVRKAFLVLSTTQARLVCRCVSLKKVLEGITQAFTNSTEVTCISEFFRRIGDLKIEVSLDAAINFGCKPAVQLNLLHITVGRILMFRLTTTVHQVQNESGVCKAHTQIQGDGHPSHPALVGTKTKYKLPSPQTTRYFEAKIEVAWPQLLGVLEDYGQEVVAATLRRIGSIPILKLQDSTFRIELSLRVGGSDSKFSLNHFFVEVCNVEVFGVPLSLQAAFTGGDESTSKRLFLTLKHPPELPITSLHDMISEAAKDLSISDLDTKLPRPVRTILQKIFLKNYQLAVCLATDSTYSFVFSIVASVKISSGSTECTATVAHLCKWTLLEVNFEPGLSLATILYSLLSGTPQQDLEHEKVEGDGPAGFDLALNKFECCFGPGLGGLPTQLTNDFPLFTQPSFSTESCATTTTASISEHSHNSS